MSIFSLPLEPEPGPDTTRMYYQAIISSSGSTIEQGVANTKTFRISPQGRRWFVPSRSYFLIKLRWIQSAAAAAAHTDVDIAAKGLAFGTGGCMFQSATVKIGSTIVSQVNQMLPQIDAMNMRMNKSAAWANTVGEALNAWSYQRGPVRYDTGGHFAYRELAYQPPLGFFNSVDHAIPGLDIDLDLQTFPNWEKQIFEETFQGVAVADNYANNFTHAPSVTLSSIVFMACFVEGPRSDDTKFVLNINEWDCKHLPLAGDNEHTTTFDVKAGTDVLAVACQDTRVGTSMFYPMTRFNCYYTAPDQLNAGAIGNLAQRNFTYFPLSQLQIEYDGQYFPQTPLQFAYGGGAETAQQSGQNNWEVLAANGTLFSSPASCETLAEAQNAGQYYLTPVLKDGTSHATRVTVTSTTRNGVAVNQPNGTFRMLLFSRAPKSFLVRTSDSMILQVQSADVSRGASGPPLGGAFGPTGSGASNHLGSFY